MATVRIKGPHVSIYLIKFEGIPIYVGQTRSSVVNRIRQHFDVLNGKHHSRNPRLHPFILANPDKSKYDVEVIEIVTRDQASERERYWIEHFDTRSNGLNVNRGGTGVMTGEDNPFYGKKTPRHVIEASVAARRGRPLSDEHKEKIRKAQLARPDLNRTVVVRDDGKHFTSVSYAANVSGVTHSAIIAAIRSGGRCRGHRWRYADEAQKEKLPNMRIVGVECIETGERFRSLEDVCRAHRVSKGNLSKHLRGGYKTVKGRTYRRIEE